MDARIVGMGHMPAVALAERSFEHLMLAAVREALDHAGRATGDAGADWIGQFCSGPVADAFSASLAPGLHASIRSENACASWAAPVRAACIVIGVGRIGMALVICVKKVTGRRTEGRKDVQAYMSCQPDEAGVSMRILGALQVTEAADAVQRPGAEPAAVVSLGGYRVTHDCSFLEAVA